MKLIIAIFIVLVGVGGFTAYQTIFANNKQQIVNNTQSEQNNTKKQNDDYLTKGSDKDDIVESNKVAILQVRKLEEKLLELTKQLNNNQNNSTTETFAINTHNINNANNKIKSTVNKSVEKIISTGEKITSQINNTLNYNINNNDQNYPDLSANNNVNNYIWQNSIVSNSQSQTSYVANEVSDNAKPINNKQQEVIPRFTITQNSVFNTKNITALLGRIPVDGNVHNPYRFILKIKDIGLFANNHKNNKFNGVVVSGQATGDLLKSCVRASIDSLTYIFSDGTISQNNQADMAFIADKYGEPCIKGKLVTNAPQYIATSSILAGVSGFAQAVADIQKTNTTSSNGEVSSQITGDLGEYAAGQTTAGAFGKANEWFDQRAKSNFDVIVADAGQDIQLIFNTEVAIDYDLNGRKLIYKNTNQEQDYADFD